ncbi:MAG TPA: FAD-dependent monooxygenase [Acidimicrobiales bacterium]|nr:FAD-dependent monooxygenase [Acidimicrobiales bacterium]
MSKAIVVGGGPTGLATAMLLAKRGVEVMVLDLEAPAPSEVDDLWETWERRSVAQFHQVHYLQPAAHAQLAAHLPEVLVQMSVAGVEEFNVPELQARHMSAGEKDVELSQFVTRTSCRRPFMEFGFVSAARACPGVAIKSASPVTALVVGPEVIKGVPHVIGVKTENGDAYYADKVRCLQRAFTFVGGVPYEVATFTSGAGTLRGPLARELSRSWSCGPSPPSARHAK